MPKISAPTVAEHRRQQREALVRAGAEILAADGLTGFTPRTVTERAGMARSTFYDYFPSKDDLLIEIALEDIEQWAVEITGAVNEAGHGFPAIEAYVRRTIEMAAQGRHALARVIRDANVAPSSMASLMKVHDALVQPLTAALATLGEEPTPARVAIVQGAVSAGVELVEHGVPAEVVLGDLMALLRGGLASR